MIWQFALFLLGCYAGGLAMLILFSCVGEENTDTFVTLFSEESPIFIKIIRFVIYPVVLLLLLYAAIKARYSY